MRVQEVTILPWQDVAVDLIGPWTVAGRGIEFAALTIIDMVTNLVEIIRIPDKLSTQIALLFENMCLI